MNKNKLIAGSLIALSALFLTGCSSSSEPAPVVTKTVTAEPELTPEQEYIENIRSFGNYYVDNNSDADLISLGQQACTVLDSGYTIEDLVNQFVYDSNLSGDEQFEFVGIIIGAGVRHFCPEYITEVQAYLT